MTGEFLAQRASNAESVSIWWRHHAFECFSSWAEILREIRLYMMRSNKWVVVHGFISIYIIYFCECVRVYYMYCVSLCFKLYAMSLFWFFLLFLYGSGIAKLRLDDHLTNWMRASTVFRICYYLLNFSWNGAPVSPLRRLHRPPN